MSSYDFEIVIGTYEHFLLGYLCSVKDEEVKQSFASHDHTSSIKSISHSGQYLASGGADDRIIIYDLNVRKECTMLVHHDSAVTSLQFTNKHTHLISGSSDGVLAITRVGNWTLEKKWDKAHKGSSILDIALHPSGKLALTIGGDNTLRTWNLIKGRQAYAINLNTKSKDSKTLERIIWSPNGTNFILYGGKYTEIWSIETGGMLKFIAYDEKVTSCIWLNVDKLIVGHENGQLSLVNINDASKILKDAHNARIKAIAKYNNWIVSIASDGKFKVWSENLDELIEQSTGCRPTCLCIVPTLQIKKESSDEEEIIENNVPKMNTKSRVIITEENSDEEKSEDVIKKIPKKKRKHK
ncbi:hypothetical protein WA026_019956 [Henosepilachna vigintioctopunctata]|uniref:P21-activated protein kinase-interacting protein 1-like n=1 Tax=Henosepilachna vigintioctopunctata TaxID=420089 RepID=A0AAW1V4C5_9CUCU